MLVVFPFLAALTASASWATGIVLAQMPARALGAFAFTRIQLVACSLLVTVLSFVLGLWQSIDWGFWPSFVISSTIGVVLGNLAMIECLRRGGPRVTELLLCLKAPIVALLAYVWLGEVLGPGDLLGGALVIGGLLIAIHYGGEEGKQPELQGRQLAPVLLLGGMAAGFQGLGFVALKPALADGAEPVAVAAIRLSGAAVLVLLIGALQSSVKVRKQQPFQRNVSSYLLFRTIVPGVIGYVIASSLLLYAFANMEAAIATILGSLSPLFVLPILWLVEGKRPNTHSVIGAALAVIGGAAIVCL
ncbi:DMT family transporter [Roseibium sp. SCP14]|uniref:DMT family transporter n=1 Tax=Roseibium sp. SCP14 TaxID=3141375 RepID=UPI0033380893